MQAPPEIKTAARGANRGGGKSANETRPPDHKTNRAKVQAPLFTAAKPRMLAWRRVVEAVAEQREALAHRIWREDPEDTHLQADVQTWCELAQALADYIRARRSA